MNSQAYVQIRPTQPHPITVICKPCGLEQPADRWHTALADAKRHNRDHHGNGAA